MNTSEIVRGSARRADYWVVTSIANGERNGTSVLRPDEARDLVFKRISSQNKYKRRLFKVYNQIIRSKAFVKANCRLLERILNNGPKTFPSLQRKW